MSEINIKALFTIPTELYLGIPWHQPGKWNVDKRVYEDDGELEKGLMDTEKYPLGFAVPIFGTKNYDKLKASVDSWASIDDYKDKGAHGHILKNEPLEGYKLKDFVSRWSTANKWFNILDPRGFHLQLSAAALSDLIENATIINGVIQGKCIWARRGTQNILVPIDSQLYKDNVTFTDLPTEYDVGDKILSRKTEYVYLGRKRVLEYFIKSEHLFPTAWQSKAVSLFKKDDKYYLSVECHDYYGSNHSWNWSSRMKGPDKLDDPENYVKDKLVYVFNYNLVKKGWKHVYYYGKHDKRSDHYNYELRAGKAPGSLLAKYDGKTPLPNGTNKVFDKDYVVKCVDNSLKYYYATIGMHNIHLVNDIDAEKVFDDSMYQNMPKSLRFENVKLISSDIGTTNSRFIKYEFEVEPVIE